MEAAPRDPDDTGPVHLLAALAIGVLTVGTVNASFALLAGGPLNLADEWLIFLVQIGIVAAPFLLLALAGIGNKWPWLVGLGLTVALWGLLSVRRRQLPIAPGRLGREYRPGPDHLLLADSDHGDLSGSLGLAAAREVGLGLAGADGMKLAPPMGEGCRRAPWRLSLIRALPYKGKNTLAGRRPPAAGVRRPGATAGSGGPVRRQGAAARCNGRVRRPGAAARCDGRVRRLGRAAGPEGYRAGSYRGRLGGSLRHFDGRRGPA
jgi:hypothetical protein